MSEEQGRRFLTSLLKWDEEVKNLAVFISSLSRLIYLEILLEPSTPRYCH